MEQSFGVPVGVLPKLRKRSPLGKVSSFHSSREPKLDGVGDDFTCKFFG